MKINYLLSRLTREKYINRWVILLIDLFLSVFSTVTSLALISYILDCDYSNQTVFSVFLASVCCSLVSFSYARPIKESSVTLLSPRPGVSPWPLPWKERPSCRPSFDNRCFHLPRFPVGKHHRFLSHLLYPDDFPCLPHYRLHLRSEQHDIPQQRQNLYFRLW